MIDSYNFTDDEEMASYQQIMNLRHTMGKITITSNISKREYERLMEIIADVLKRIESEVKTE